MRPLSCSHKMQCVPLILHLLTILPACIGTDSSSASPNRFVSQLESTTKTTATASSGLLGEEGLSDATQVNHRVARSLRLTDVGIPRLVVQGSDKLDVQARNLQGQDWANYLPWRPSDKHRPEDWTSYDDDGQQHRDMNSLRRDLKARQQQHQWRQQPEVDENDGHRFSGKPGQEELSYGVREQQQGAWAKPAAALINSMEDDDEDAAAGAAVLGRQVIERKVDGISSVLDRPLLAHFDKHAQPQRPDQRDKRFGSVGSGRSYGRSQAGAKSEEESLLESNLEEMSNMAANTVLARQQRNGRMYDVPQIECPRSPDATERFACPRPDRRGRFRCIDDHSLCDGFYDCPGKEDESPEHCLFYKTTKAHLDVMAEALLRWARGR